MKKLFVIILCLICLCSCAIKEEAQPEESVPDVQKESEIEESEAPVEPEESQVTEEPQQEMAPKPMAVMPENFGEEGGLTLNQLEEGKSYMAYAELLYDIKSPHEKCTQAQGAVFDGEYFYSAMMDYQDMCVLVVSDTEGNIIRSSEPLNLDHANSITYVPKENALYVAHCTGSEESDFYTYSVVDKDSLEIIKTEIKDIPMTCFAYCEEKDMFYSARWSGETLDIWNGNFEHTKSMDVPMRSSLSQGCYATEEGFWYARSYDNDWQNEIAMYDWEGNLVHEIVFGNLWVELEDIVYMDDDTLYVAGKSLYGNGSQIFEVTFYEQPEAK